MTLALLCAACRSVSAPAKPQIPTGLAASGGVGQIVLTWNVVASATSYLVLRGDARSGNKVAVATPASNAYTDSGIGAGVTKFYLVRALGPAGTSADSAEVSATTLLPTGPTGLVATSANASVALVWNALAGATSYRVLRSSTGETAVQIGVSTNTSYRDANVRNGVTYRYTVRALTAAGETVDSAPADAEPHRELCVTDGESHQVLVFDAERAGDAAPLRAFGSLTGVLSNGIALDATHGEIFSANYHLNSVTTHAQTATGNVAPARVLTASYPGSVAYDPTDDRIIVAELERIETFNRSVSRDSPPVRTLRMPGVAPGKIVLTGPAHGDRMFVIDLSNYKSIHVFSRTDSGSVAPAAIITSSDITFLHDIAYDPVRDELLVSASRSDFSSGILAFPAASSGPSSPTRVLAGAQTRFGDPTLAVDSLNDLLYTVDGDGTVRVFPLGFGASPNIAPVRTLGGPSTQLSYSNGVTHIAALDTARNQLVVQNGSRILVFDAAASGNTAPLSAISSASSGVESPAGISVDPSRGEIFVANQWPADYVSTHRRSAMGDAPPLRTLRTPSNLTNGQTADVFFDAAHDELIVALDDAPPTVQFFARDAEGSAAPLRVLGGSHTLLASAVSVGLDTANDAVVVADGGSAIRRFARSFTSGDEAPLTSIAGPHTGLSFPQGLFVDNLNREIFVTDQVGVLVFALGADGDVAPLRTLHTANPSSFVGVYVDPVADEVFVMEYGVIKVFARTASGNAPPLRSIAGPSSRLFFPKRGAICN